MAVLLPYFLKCVAVSGILYAYYLLLLRNKAFHAFNRGFLLFTIGISLMTPLIQLPVFPTAPVQANKMAAAIYILQENIAVHESQSATVSWSSVAVFGICAVSVFFLVGLFWRIRWVFKVKQAGKATKLEGYTLVETTAPGAPFSFLHYLFWQQGSSFTDTIGQTIFQHELAHIKQHHTYDKLFAQVVACVVWLNPFYWLLQKELATIHEFMADQVSIEKGDTDTFARMLLQAHGEGRYLSPAHGFFNSSIQRRLRMIAASDKAGFSYARRIVAIPIAALLVVMFSTKIEAQEGKKASGATAPIDHIEMYGQTGKGDTATVYFVNGTKEIYFLKTAADYIAFQKKYGPYLLRPPAPQNEQQTKKRAVAESVIRYVPLDPIPDAIRKITFGPERIWYTLQDGIEHQVDLHNVEERKSFESAFGSLQISSTN